MNALKKLFQGVFFDPGPPAETYSPREFLLSAEVELDKCLTALETNEGSPVIIRAYTQAAFDLACAHAGGGKRVAPTQYAVVGRKFSRAMQRLIAFRVLRQQETG